MADLTAFYPWVEVAVEGAPRKIVEQAVRRSIDRFLRYTGLWSEQHAAIPLEDGEASYAVTPPEDGLLTRLSAVHFKTDPLSPAHPGWGAQYTGGFAPYAYWVPADPQNTIVLSPTPAGTFTADDTITFLGIYTLVADAETVPDFLATEYLEGIVDGAIQMLLAIPGKGWSDPVEAERRRRSFMKSCADGRVRAATGGTVSVLPVAHRYFA